MLTLLIALQQEGDSGAAAAAGGAGGLIGLIVGVLVIAGMWKIFSKAGQPGWAAIVPIYNIYVLMKVAGKPGWWVLLYFIPLVNFVVLIIALFGLAKAFGKGGGFALGLILLSPIFIPLLGFSDARYIGTSDVRPATALA